MTDIDDQQRASIARDTGWSFLAEAVRLIAGIGVFLLVARSLGPSEFGVFVAIAAIVTFMAPFANLGGPLLLVQRVRRDDHELSSSFRIAWSMVLAGGAAAVLVAVVLITTALDQAPPVAVLAIAIGEFILAGTVSLCSYLAIACGDLQAHALVVSASSVLRLVAAGVLLTAGAPSVTSWALTQMVALGVTAIGAVVLTSRHFRVHIGLGRISRPDVVDGLPYSASIAAFSAQDGIDKPLLVRFGWSLDAGLYAAAYRVAALAFMPVQALLVATLGRSFTAGKQGIRPAMRLARRLLVPSLAYSIGVGLAILLFAPLAKPLLGDDFEGAVPMLRWLAFLPVVRTLQYFPGNALTGAGYQRARLGILVITLVISAGLCLALIPDHSWRGAVIATFVAEVAYCLMLWGFAWHRSRRESAEAQ